MAAGLALGCQGVWTGSIWLAAAESDYQEALVDKLLAAPTSPCRPHTFDSGTLLIVSKASYFDKNKHNVKIVNQMCI